MRFLAFKQEFLFVKKISLGQAVWAKIKRLYNCECWKQQLCWLLLFMGPRSLIYFPKKCIKVRMYIYICKTLLFIEKCKNESNVLLLPPLSLVVHWTHFPLKPPIAQCALRPTIARCARFESAHSAQSAQSAHSASAQVASGGGAYLLSSILVSPLEPANF